LYGPLEFDIYWWIQDTRVSSIVWFTILVLPVLLDEEYWCFQYRVFYNTSIISIVGWRILELPVLCIDQRFWYSSIVNARYWYIQYYIYTIMYFRYCNITILVLSVLLDEGIYNTGIPESFIYAQYRKLQYSSSNNTDNTSIVMLQYRKYIIVYI
jgi:hypothetical protein